MRGHPHSDETRAAVLAALLTGQSVHEVAAQYGVSRATVREWRAGYHARAPFFGGEPGTQGDRGDHDVDQDRPQKREHRLEHLVVEYLAGALLTMTAQQGRFRDPEWLRSQSAADLAVLHGVTCDKVFRLLAALEQVDDGNDHEKG